jgi:hypothetical protein
MSSVSHLGQKLCHFFWDNLCPQKEFFWVCCQKCSGHKAVKFGRNTYLNCDYISQKIIQFWGGRVVNLFSVLIWCGMTDPMGSISKEECLYLIWPGTSEDASSDWTYLHFSYLWSAKRSADICISLFTCVLCRMFCVLTLCNKNQALEIFCPKLEVM